MSRRVSFIDTVNNYLETKEVILPVFNYAAIRIQEELAKAEPSLATIEQIITADQSLASQVLRIANSSFYRGLAEVSTIRGAIMRLGMTEIGNIVLLVTTKNTFAAKNQEIALFLRKMWQHSVGCAYASSWLSKRYGLDVSQTDAFFCGLFHDVGKLFLTLVIEQMKAQNPNIRITNMLVQEALDKLHTLQGYNLLRKWNMPDKFCTVARDHHSPEIDSGNSLLTIVKLADLACHKMGIGVTQNPSIILPLTPEATALNCTEIDLAKLEILLEDTASLNK